MRQLEVIFSIIVLVSLSTSIVSCDTDRSQRAAGTASPPTDPRTPVVMHRKLGHAHGVLDALAVEDYNSIRRHADALTALSEESDWFVHDTESYIAFSRQFRESTQLLAETARTHDLNRTSDAYIAMMQSCVACHEYLRAEGLYRDMPGRVSMLR